MEQPKGFERKTHSSYVNKLNKALYKLTQAPRAWHEKIAEFLVQSGYFVVLIDLSLFTKAHNDKITTILVYMDDLIITRDDEEEIG